MGLNYSAAWERAREKVRAYGTQCQTLQLAETDRDQHNMGVEVTARMRDVETEFRRMYEAGRERGERSLRFTQEWYAVRFERLRALLKQSHPDVWRSVASIIANGTSHPHEPPTYAQRLNLMRFRAEAAERAIADRDADLLALAERWEKDGYYGHQHASELRELLAAALLDEMK